MQRKIPMLLGKAYERHQRRTIGLTVLAALVVPLTAGTMLVLMPPARAVDNWEVEGANGTLHVYGALTESACSLEMTTARQEVWLGETGTAHFQRPGDRGTPVAFELTLKDCLRAPASNRDAWIEVPVAIVLLCWMGITSPEDLRKKRPYVLVGAFVVGMLLTPPDVFSQTLLAIPMYCLFEIGVFFSRFYVGKGRNREEENDAEAESEKTEE